MGGRRPFSYTEPLQRLIPSVLESEKSRRFSSGGKQTNLLDLLDKGGCFPQNGEPWILRMVYFR